MLERTSACLDTGVRLSLRAQRHAPKSRRLLHHHFWHQQAPDVELPVWHHSNVSPSVPPASDSQDAPFLDFLYPAPTLAFMTRLSQWEKWARRNSRLPVLRGYSSLSNTQDANKNTTQNTNEDDDQDILPPPVDQDPPPADQESTPALQESPLAGQEPLPPKQKLPPAPKESPPIDQKSPPHDELRQLLSLDRTTPASDLDITRVWQLYSQLTHHDLDLHQDMIVWFSRQKHRQASFYALELFSRLPTHHRSAPTFHAIIAVHLTLDHESDAIALHEQASELPLKGSIGSNLLMAHAVAKPDWPLALNVQHLFHNYTKKCASSELPLLWDKVRNIDNLADKLDSLLLYHRSHSDATQLHQLYGSIWTEFLSLRVKSRHFLTTDQEGCRLRGQIRRLVHHTHRNKLDSAENYEKTILAFLSIPRSASHFESSALINSTYLLYRRSGHFAPSQALLLQMLRYWKEHLSAFVGLDTPRSFVGVKRITSDWTRFHNRLSDSALLLIMDAFSRVGNVGGVESYAALYKSLHPTGLRNSSKLRPLIYVHAVLANPSAAAKQLFRIKEDFGVEPDLGCWNTAIHAHNKANDLTGAMNMLEKMLEAGVQPDAYTYGPLLNLFAKRGDVDGATTLLNIAKSGGVKPTVHMLNSMIVASVNAEDIEGAQEGLDFASKAVQAGEVEGSLTLCFNTILVAHAFRRDLHATMATYRRMKDEKIELDEHTYGALMQVLCFFNQTPSAHKILRSVMPRTGIRPLSFHYAIIMAGYVNQGMYKDALQVEREMKKANVRATASSRAVGLKAKALLEHAKLRYQTDETGYPLPLQDTIDEFVKLLESPKTSPPGNQPMPGFRHESHASDPFDVGYLIYIHGARRSYEAVHSILRLYEEKRSQYEGIAEPPIMRLIITLMSVHCRAGEYEHVDRYWSLIKSRADQLRHEHPTASEIWARFKSPGVKRGRTTQVAPQIPPALRFTLSRPLRYYIISQFAQSSSSKIISTVLELLSTGYALDNRAWNTYIVHLCQVSPPRALLAFSLVEKFLVRDWPGWINARRGVITNKTIWPKRSAVKEGLTYIKARYLHPGQLMPQYKTMVYLASALLEVRGFETSGILKEQTQKGAGGSQYEELRKQVGSIREIRQKAPRTLHAVQSMPRVIDHLQATLLGKND